MKRSMLMILALLFLLAGCEQKSVTDVSTPTTAPVISFPFNYYSGTYDSKTNEITLDHKREAPSTVQIQIKSLEVYDSFNPHNKIVLEVTSTIDQTVPIAMTCQQSDDNLGLGDYKELTLTKNQSQTVELSFIGFAVQHWIEIKAGNTFIYLTIIP